MILKNNLKDGLDVISRTGGEGLSTLPILKNFLMETVDNKIKLSATNLEIAATCFVSGKIVEDGGITIPLNIFNSIINNIQNERINLESNEDSLIIKTDNYEAKIQGIKKEEFPIIPGIGNDAFCFEINGNLLREVLSFVVGAAQVSDLRPEMGGILFNFQSTFLKLAATDSFRLAEKTVNENQFKTEAENRLKIIIPLKTINEVIRIFKKGNDKISVYVDNNQVLFRDENVELVSRIIGGDFPDYEVIIPQELKTEVILNRDELINAIKLTSSFTDRLNEVRLVIKEKAKNVEIFSSGQGLGENKYLIPAKIKGPSLEAVFNWKYLIDGLKVFSSENVNLGLNGDDKPAIIKSLNDASSFYILMPIKAE